jgi:MFS family permease
MSIIIGTLIFLVRGSVQTAAKGLGWMYAGRFVTGLGIGMLAMLALLYQSEIAHPTPDLSRRADGWLPLPFIYALSVPCAALRIPVLVRFGCSCGSSMSENQDLYQDTSPIP